MPPAQELVLGIDFGTSFSSAAVYHEGKIRAILDSGEAQIPTVVHIPVRGDAVVGMEAVRLGMAEPADTVASIKRLLGKRIDDPMVKALDASVGYRIVEGPGKSILLKIRGRDYAPAQIASMVLARLRSLAQLRYGERVKGVVLAVPADSPQEYMAALGTAAKLAGLEVKGFVPEPIAGALAFGIGSQPASRRIAVCDFGGGTFDVSVVEQQGLRFHALACGADHFLGGDDFDLAMADAVSGAIFKATRADMRRDAVRWAELVRRCESVKRQLSFSPEALLQMRNAYVVNRAAQDLEMRVGRDYMEPRWMPLVERCLDTTREVIARTGTDVSLIEQVVLIGGTTLIPVVRRKISELFGRTPMSSDTAQMAVVTGATVVAARYQPQGAAELPSLADADEKAARTIPPTSAPPQPTTVNGTVLPMGAVRR
jgi:molecular chaperone DnaK